MLYLLFYIINKKYNIYKFNLNFCNYYSNKIIAMASFKIDSPNIKEKRVESTPNSLNIASTATGSVAEIKAPKAKLAVKVISLLK